MFETQHPDGVPATDLLGVGGRSPPKEPNVGSTKWLKAMRTQHKLKMYGSTVNEEPTDDLWRTVLEPAVMRFFIENAPYRNMM